jgi:hypothetical protein
VVLVDKTVELQQIQLIAQSKQKDETSAVVVSQEIDENDQSLIRRSSQCVV